MIKISNVKIKRYRSIMDMTLKIEDINNLISICGQNNCGKTNTLRAINLFFNPEEYDDKLDMPNHKGVTGGASIHPEIQVDFLDGKDIYRITRVFKTENRLITFHTNGKKKEKNGKFMKISNKESVTFLKKINFFFIPSINTITPKLIRKVLEKVYDLEYNKARFTGLKKDLKASFEAYLDGLEKILEPLSSSINPLFKQYNENWGVEFNLPKNVDKFRDLISEDVVFDINDKSNNQIDSKGAGLQRLALILLHFKIIEKLLEQNESAILLIDEPDVYLHDGLKHQLFRDLKSNSERAQIFVTTHSSIFIDTYKLKNVFLLEIAFESKEYTRKKGKETNIIRTDVVDISKEDGLRKIKTILGIKEIRAEPIEVYNLIVEGETDKKYITELCKYFGIDYFNIISANGVDNIKKYLEFYDAYYKNLNSEPFIKVLFDNDIAGRKAFDTIKCERFNNIKINKLKIINFSGKQLNSRQANCEIEDFMYPKAMEYLTNIILKKMKLKQYRAGSIEALITKPAYENSGILALLDSKKNENNQEEGNRINFNSLESSGTTKKSIANNFNLEANPSLSKIIEEQNIAYPNVKEFLIDLFKIPEEVTT